MIEIMIGKKVYIIDFNIGYREFSTYMSENSQTHLLFRCINVA